MEVDLEFYGNMERHVLAIIARGEEMKAVIRFGRTSGTVHSIRLGAVSSQIVVRYHDFGGKYLDHSINLNNIVAPKEERREVNKLELGRLGKAEISEIKKWNGTSRQTLFGNKVRDMVVNAVRKAGEVAGVRINPSRYKIGAEINTTGAYSKGRRREVDAVFESMGGGLIVLEVKATVDLENIWEQWERAWKQLKGDPENNEPGYIQLIEEHGLRVFNEIKNDVDAYIVVLVKVDLETGLLNIKRVKEVSDE